MHTFFQFFLELQHFILTKVAQGDTESNGAELEGTTSCDQSSVKSRQTVKSIKLLRQQDEEYASLLGTVFDTVINAFTSLVKEMETSLVQCIVSSVKTKCYGLKQEK